MGTLVLHRDRILGAEVEAVGGCRVSVPNQALQQTAAAILVTPRVKPLSAAAAAELGRWAKDMAAHEEQFLRDGLFKTLREFQLLDSDFWLPPP
jgi:hypothetical protein